jgi:hypothetical protein
MLSIKTPEIQTLTLAPAVCFASDLVADYAANGGPSNRSNTASTGKHRAGNCADRRAGCRAV